MMTLSALSRICSCILLTILVLARTAVPAAAEDLLVIRNATAPAQAEVRFSEADLLALPQVTIRTQTDYTDGVVEFIGPLARDAVAFIEIGTATTVPSMPAKISRRSVGRSTPGASRSKSAGTTARATMPAATSAKTVSVLGNVCAATSQRMRPRALQSGIKNRR